MIRVLKKKCLSNELAFVRFLFCLAFIQFSVNNKDNGIASMIWDKVFNNGSSKICGRQPLKNLKWYGLLKQILHGPFLNTLSHIIKVSLLLILKRFHSLLVCFHVDFLQVNFGWLAIFFCQPLLKGSTKW